MSFDWETVKNVVPGNSSMKPDQTGKGVKQSEMFNYSVYSRLGNKRTCCIIEPGYIAPVLSIANCHCKIKLGWFVDLILNIPVNNFSVMLGWSHRFLGITSTYQYFLGSKCALLKDTTRFDPSELKLGIKNAVSNLRLLDGGSAFIGYKNVQPSIGIHLQKI